MASRYWIILFLFVSSILSAQKPDSIALTDTVTVAKVTEQPKTFANAKGSKKKNTKSSKLVLFGPAADQQKKESAESLISGQDKVTVIEPAKPAKRTEAKPRGRNNGKMTVLPHPAQDTLCAWAWESREELTGIKRRGTKAYYFFGFTRPEDRQLLNGADFLECYAGLSTEADQKMLNLTYVIDSPYGKTEYGEVLDQSRLDFMMINGDIATLFANKGVKPEVKNGKTYYYVNYVIDKSTMKTLQQTELDRVRMNWSVGYEDYEIFLVDFLMKRMTCLKNQ